MGIYVFCECLPVDFSLIGASRQQYEANFTKSNGQTGPAAKSTRPEVKRPKFAGLSRKAKRRKMADEEDDSGGTHRAVNAAIRQAKKSSRPSKIGIPDSKVTAQKSGHPKKKKKVSGKGKGGGFERDMNDRVRS